MRVLLDLSVLIEVRRQKRMRLLGRAIRRQQVAVASYSLRRLRKSSSWRGWVNQNQQMLEVRLQPGREQALYAGLLRQHSQSSSNPWIADDDLMAITIASCRGWQLAMRDKNATAIAQALGVTVLGVEKFIRAFGGQQQTQLPGFDEP